MKVKELISLLQKEDQEAEVVYLTKALEHEGTGLVESIDPSDLVNYPYSYGAGRGIVEIA